MAAREAFSGHANRLSTLACDVASPTEVELVFAQMKTRHPSLNALVCWAGVLRLGSLEDMTAENFVVLKSTRVVPGMRAALPMMKAAAAESQLARIILLVVHRGTAKPSLVS
jgi:NAD(P)-dependent dehydrogenase (short-subunit alcohol dehydrogenase family)